MLYTHGRPTITLEQIDATYKVPTKDDLRAKLGARANEGSGSRWAPVPHGTLIRDIHTAVEKRGMKVEREEFILSEDTHSIYGSMQFLNFNLGLTGMAPVLGFRSDNLQRFGLLGVTGVRVFICDNGAINGDFLFGQKHTTFKTKELTVGIDEGMTKWAWQAGKMKRFVEFMQETPLERRDADHLLLESSRQGIIAANQLGKIDAQYRDYEKPDHPHNVAFGQRNLWSLYNAVTEVAKGWRSPMVGERGMKGFPRVATAVYGYTDLEPLVDAAVGGDPDRN